MPNFISISGVAGSGKTTIAETLKNYFHWQDYAVNDFSFAGPLKDALCMWFGWDRVRLDHDYPYKEGSSLDDGSPDPYCQALGMTRRKIMQLFGTECMRDGMTQDFWIILADIAMRLGKIPPADIYLISDARMVNELTWVRSLNGFEIRTTRIECPRGEDPATVAHAAVTLTRSTTHLSENEFMTWKDFDEDLINMIDHNKTEIQNKNELTRYLTDITIPEIRKRFNIKGKGKRNHRTRY